MWLTFLARHLHRHHSRDLAWWQLHRCLTPWSRRLCSVVLAVIGGLGTGVGIGLASGFTVGLVSGIAGGVGVGLMVNPPISPWHFNPQSLTRMVYLRRKLVGGLAVGITTGVVIGLGLGLGLIVGVTGGLVAGFLMGVMELLTAPAEEIRSPSPISVLRNDRVVSILRAVLGGLGLGLVIGLFVGPGIATSVGATVGLAAGVVIGLAGRRFGVRGHAPEASAWAWFVACRTWLAARGTLPWRLLRFLDDAHRRGVLRQNGAVYQFRHARLQDRLAQRPQSDAPHRL